jgi:hypothetical protein
MLHKPAACGPVKIAHTREGCDNYVNGELVYCANALCDGIFRR